MTYMKTKDEIIKLLKTNDKAVARAVYVLNERQTASEQTSAATINHNGIGFTPADARMGTSMAQFYARNGYLTPKQIAYWRKPNVRGVPRICKYASQLLEISKLKATAVTQPKNQYIGSDVGNLMEEKMILEEQLAAFQEGAMGEGVEQDDAMDALVNRINLINAALAAA